MKRAPEHLGQAGKRFWTDVLKQYDFQEPHHFALLEQAAACLDRIEQARRQVEQDGAYVKDRYFQVKAHPGVIIQRDMGRLFASLCREMSLDLEPPPDAPRGKGRY